MNACSAVFSVKTAIKDHVINSHSLSERNIAINLFFKAGMTLSNLLHIFFDSCSANTKKYFCNHLENKHNHIKAHFFLARQHNQLTTHYYFDFESKNCTRTGVDQTIRQR